jgi:hypothetical protein
MVELRDDLVGDTAATSMPSDSVIVEQQHFLGG